MERMFDPSPTDSDRLAPPAALPLVLLLALAACSEEAVMPEDGGASADAIVAADGGSRLPAAPAAPAAAMLPELTPCPSGWREVAPSEEGRAATCDPWPAGGRVTTCPAGQAHFPGEPGCASIGSACPVGEF